MEVRSSWFGGHPPVNGKGSSATIGAGDHGVVTVTSTTLKGVEANDKYSIKVVAGSGASKPMTATFANDLITVTLGTTAGSVADDTKNTAKLVAGAIDALADFSATYSGTGATVIPVTASKALEGGQDGTISPEPLVAVRVWDDANSEWDYYINLEPNGRYDANWRRFNLEDY